jgi:hypothetical protein
VSRHTGDHHHHHQSIIIEIAPQQAKCLAFLIQADLDSVDERFELACFGLRRAG